MSVSEIESNPPAALWRRLAAIVYDGLVLIAVLALATFAFVPFLDGKVLVPEEVGWLAYAYRAYLLLIATVFFGYFWTRAKGQTLGMQAWRLRIETTTGQTVSWGAAIKRMAILWALTLPPIAGYWLLWDEWPTWARAVAWTIALAPLVLCYASAAFSRDKRSWHDRWTHTRIVQLPKR